MKDQTLFLVAWSICKIVSIELKCIYIQNVYKEKKGKMKWKKGKHTKYNWVN